MLGLWSLPPLLLIGCGLIGYPLWRDSQTLPLPAAADIQRIGFGINLGYTKAKWYALPLPTGKGLIDVFRGSVVKPRKQDPNVFAEIAPDEYTVHIVIRRERNTVFPSVCIQTKFMYVVLGQETCCTCFLKAESLNYGNLFNPSSQQTGLPAGDIPIFREKTTAATILAFAA